MYYTKPLIKANNKCTANGLSDVYQ